MKYLPTNEGPFPERPYFSDTEIETLCCEELASVGLLPAAPEPIRIDRFIEKRFGVVPEYEDLGDGVLGMTQFGPNGVTRVTVSRSLEEQGTEVSERQIRTTLAHEAGHGLLHAPLFAGCPSQPLFGDISDPTRPKVLCRGRLEEGGARSYSGEWWEFQANRVIGALLMPRHLAMKALDGYLVPCGTLGEQSLNRFRQEEAARSLANTFDVNPAVSRIRIEVLFPSKRDSQMYL